MAHTDTSSDTRLHAAGFAPPADIGPGGKRGTIAIAALVMIVALALGTLTAMVAVTIGIAHGSGAAPQRLYANEFASLQPRG